MDDPFADIRRANKLEAERKWKKEQEEKGLQQKAYEARMQIRQRALLYDKVERTDYAISPEYEGKAQEAVQSAAGHFWNVILDINTTLRKPK